MLFEEIELQTLIYSLISGVVELALFILVVVLAALSGQGFVRYWKRGLLLGVVVVAMVLPSSIYSVLHVEVDDLAFYMGMLIGVGLTVLKAGWWMVVFIAAACQYERLKRNTMPLLTGDGRLSWGWVAGGLIFGMLAGAVSSIVFILMGVEVSDLLKSLDGVLLLSENDGDLFFILASLGFVTGMAVVEELVFRGVLQGALLRVAKGKLAVVVTMILVSGLWASLHLLNTNAPMLKMGQIFLIGLVLCEITRRGSLEAAIAGHVGLNWMAVAVEMYAMG